MPILRQGHLYSVYNWKRYRNIIMRLCFPFALVLQRFVSTTVNGNKRDSKVASKSENAVGAILEHLALLEPGIWKQKNPFSFSDTSYGKYVA